MASHHLEPINNYPKVAFNGCMGVDDSSFISQPLLRAETGDTLSFNSLSSYPSVEGSLFPCYPGSYLHSTPCYGSAHNSATIPLSESFLDYNYNPTSTPNYNQPETTSDEQIKAVVERNGYISLMLTHEVLVDIAPNQAVRVTNKRQGVVLTFTGCGAQMSMVHPLGRIFQYSNRLEVQTSGNYKKTAKIWPKGVSFTTERNALVYLVDKAGIRTTTDSFYDLHNNNIADCMFLGSLINGTDHVTTSIIKSIRHLNEAQFWRTADGLNCWGINGIIIKQTQDGLTMVEREQKDNKHILKTSPQNGKARMESQFVYVTASIGDAAHIFVKSEDRRFHYNGSCFQIRNGGHSAGYDENNQFRIW